MKKLKIGVCRGAWATNIGNAFCNFGAEATIRLAFPNADIFQVGGASHWIFKTSTRYHKIPYEDVNSLEIGEIADLDVLVFAGMSMCEEFVVNNGITFVNAAKRGVAFILLGAGADLYTQKEADIFSAYLNGIGKYAVITRDDDTFNLFRGSLKNMYSGIDSAFFLPDYYKPPKLCIPPYDIVNFDSGETVPHISHNVEHIIYTHHDLWGIPIKEYLTKPNTLISDVPQDFINLYSQVNETYSNRVHACIATLAYGNKARLYSTTKRKALFNKVNAFGITQELTSIDLDSLQELKNSQVLKTRSMIMDMIDSKSTRQIVLNKHQDPLVSIVLPTYNGTKYIADSIRSCLSQTYRNIELIVVDDGSTNNVCEIVEEFAKQDSRVRLLRHSENRKLPAALNTGFNEAKGDYFTWTSDDNMYKENAIEKMVNCLASHSNVDIVYANYDLLCENGNVYHCEKGLPERLLIENTIGACFLYKNTVHHKLKGFNENRFLFEDLDFWVRAYEHFNFFKMNENLYIYRLHDKSLTTTRQMDIHRGTMNFILEEAEKRNRFSSEIKIEAYWRALKFAMMINDGEKAETILKLIRKHNLKLCIFCAGAHGLALYHQLKSFNIKPDFFADNNTAKHGKDIIDGIKCLSFNELAEMKRNTLVIVANQQPNAITKQLCEAGFSFVTVN